MKLLIIIAIFAIFTGNLFSQEKYNIDVKTSELRWEGKKIIGGHWGTVNFQDGFLTVKANKITGGEFTIDMKSIKG